MPKLRLGKDAKKNGTKNESEVATSVTSVALPAAGSSDEQNELGRLRGILFGSLQTDHEQALARLENRIAGQAAQLRGELEDLVRRLENRISELDARSTRDQGDLRDQMHSQRNLLNDAIEERAAQVTKLVTEGVTELRDTKIDRHRFSQFLTDLSKHLEQQSAPVVPVSSDAPVAEAASKDGALRLGRAPWHPSA